MLAYDEDEAGSERRSEPYERSGVQHAEQERRDGGQRHQLPQPIRPGGQRHERGQDGQRPRRPHLLDAAPERVPVQQRRLRTDDGRHRAQPAGLDDASGQRVEAEREHGGHDGHRRLIEPERVAADDLVADAERQERRERVPLVEQQVDDAEVRRELQAVHAAPVLHGPVDERGERRVVVELDVAGERRRSREDDRRRVGGECPHSRRDRPPVHVQAAPRPDDHEARHCRHDHGGSRELCRGVRQHRELRHERDDGKAAGDDEGSGQLQARHALEQEPAAPREGDEQEREGDPGNEQRAHGAGRPVRPSLADGDDLSLRDELLGLAGNGRIYLDLHVLVRVGQVDVRLARLRAHGEGVVGCVDDDALPGGASLRDGIRVCNRIRGDGERRSFAPTSVPDGR